MASRPKLVLSFGPGETFRSLAKVAPMIASSIAEWDREYAEYLKTKTVKRGPYQKRKK